MSRQYKLARKNQKLKIKDVAEKLDISPSTLGAWEAERKSPSIESLESMADLYQVTTDFLLGRDNPVSESSLPLSIELLNMYHGKPVWSSDYGWMLVNSNNKELLCLSGESIHFENSGSVYAAQPPFYEATLPTAKPLAKQELSNCNVVWLEPISHDSDLREQLRGWYRICDKWAENDYGIRFFIDTYGFKWLAFKSRINI